MFFFLKMWQERIVWGFACSSMGTFSSQRAVELLAAGWKCDPINLLVINPLRATLARKKPLNLDPYSLQQGKRSGFGGERGGVSSNEGWLPGCHASKEHGPNVFKSPVRGLGVTDASEMAPGPQWPFWGALPPDRARRRGNAGWLPSPKMDPQGFVPQGPS